MRMVCARSYLHWKFVAVQRCGRLEITNGLIRECDHTFHTFCCRGNGCCGLHMCAKFHSHVLYSII